MTISKVPTVPAFHCSETPGGLEMYGRGDTADFKRLREVFDSPNAVRLLETDKLRLLFPITFNDNLLMNFKRLLKEGPPLSRSSAPPEPQRPPAWSSNSTSSASWDSTSWSSWNDRRPWTARETGADWQEEEPDSSSWWGSSRWREAKR